MAYQPAGLPVLNSREQPKDMINAPTSRSIVGVTVK